MTHTLVNRNVFNIKVQDGKNKILVQKNSSYDRAVFVCLLQSNNVKDAKWAQIYKLQLRPYFTLEQKRRLLNYEACETWRKLALPIFKQGTGGGGAVIFISTLMKLMRLEAPETLCIDLGWHASGVTGSKHPHNLIFSNWHEDFSQQTNFLVTD